MFNLRRVIGVLKDPRIIVPLLILIGVVLRLVQYLSQRPLWLDEAMLTINILHRSFRGLFVPLEYEQQAPIGFLLIEKTLATLFGHDELVLRAFPLIASIASLGAMAALAMRVLPSSFAYLAILLYVFSAPLIYYASEVKPYALDVTVGVFLTWLASRIFVTTRTASKKLFLAICILGFIGLWFSQAVAFILATIGLAGMIDSVVKRRVQIFVVWAAISIAWLASFLIQGSITLGAYFERFRSIWSNMYAPFPLRSYWDLRWYAETTVQLFRRPGGIDWWPIGVVSTCAGIWYLLRAKPKLLFLLLMPCVLAFTASIFWYYPFADRFLLFFAPGLLLLMTFGLWRIHSIAWHSRWVSLRIISCLLIAGLIMNTVSLGFYRLHNPVRFEVMTPLLTYYTEHRQKGDTLYLYYASAFAFSFYAPRFNIQPADYITGVDRSQDLMAYKRDLSQLQGKPRVWVLFSHVYNWGPVDEEKYFLSQLDGMGRRVDEMHTNGAALYLYDLSRSPQLP